jgi:hypothetical protein
MHIVMHSDKHKNVSDALHKTNGLAVLGYFIDVSINVDIIGFCEIMACNLWM